MNDQLGKLTDGGHSPNATSDATPEGKAEISWEFRPVPLIWGLAFFCHRRCGDVVEPRGFQR